MRAIHESFFGCNQVFHLASFLFAAKAQADSTVSQSVEQPDAIIEMYCDSQAAIRILQASGLQRRSRHVELRVYFCQELVKQGKIKLNWIDAGGQIADALTKTLGAKLFHRFVVLMGYLERSELSTEAYAHELILRSQIRTSPAKSKSMKSQQVAYSDLLPSSHSGVPANESKVKPNDNSASSVPDMLPGSPSSVSEPEAIRSLLIDARSISQVRAPRFENIFLEICCDRNSQLSNIMFKMCPHNWLIIRITEDSPLEVHQPEIIQLLSRHKGFSFSHCSLPCTGGSNIQNLNKNESLKQHRHDTFFHLLSLCEKICASSSHFSFELPKRNNYWKSEQLHKSLKNIGRKLFCEFPKLCSFDVPVSKVFLWVGSHPTIVRKFSKHAKECSCSYHLPFNSVDWTSTGRYPENLCKVIASGVISISRAEPSASGGGYIMFEPGWNDILFSVPNLVSHPIDSSN